MPEVGRQVRQLRLRVDALSIPFAHTVANHGVTKIMDSRPDPATGRLKASTAQYLDQEDAQSTVGGAPPELLIPEQATIRARRPSALFAGHKIILDGRDHPRGQRDSPTFQELRVSNLDPTPPQTHIPHPPSATPP